MKRVFFEICLLIIVAVAAIDSYINLRYPVDSSQELNPIASYILRSTNEDLAFLISLKLFTTAITAIFLQHVYRVHKNYAILICGSLAIVQIFVLAFLFWG
jgi:hypothetical protein